MYNADKYLIMCNIKVQVALHNILYYDTYDDVIKGILKLNVTHTGNQIFINR